MGHGGHLGKEHRALADRLQHGPLAMVEPTSPTAKAAWQDILETLFSPDDAALAAKLPVLPTSVERIAGRVRLEKESVRARLETMADRGLVLDLTDRRSGETLYMLAPPMVGLFEFSMMRLADHLPKAKLAKAYDAYLDDPSFMEEASGADTVFGRALAHEAALTGDLLSEVLDWERAGALVDDASRLGITNCFCRHKALHVGTACDAPLEMCLSLNGGAEYLIRHGLSREISREEGLEVLAAAREAGLVHIADNVQEKVTYICSCCSCCCEELHSVRVGHSVVVPSGFQPLIDPESCNGCARCLRACPVEAISLVARRPVSAGEPSAGERAGGSGRLRSLRWLWRVRRRRVGSTLF